MPVVYEKLVIGDLTIGEDIFYQIDNHLFRIGSGNPNGSIVARKVGQRYYDQSSNLTYICVATDGTVGGSVWQSPTVSVARSLSIGVI